MRRIKFTKTEKVLLRAVGIEPRAFQPMAILVEHLWGSRDLTGMTLDEIMAPLEEEGLVNPVSFNKDVN